MRLISSNRLWYGRQLLLAAVGVCLSLTLSGPAKAQRAVIEPFRVPTVGLPPAGPSVGTTVPRINQGVLQRLPTAPKIEVQRAAPVAVPTSRAVRFRCELAPHAEACREPGLPDGGGDDSDCSCARDRCYWTGQGRHVCEKLQ